MIVWALGSDAIDVAVDEFAAAGGHTAVKSTKLDATMEDIWADLMHDPAIRQHIAPARSKDPIIVVVYVANNDYDTEGTISRIVQRLPTGSKILYLLPPDPSDNALDGFTHFASGVAFGVIGTKTLSELYNEA